MKFKMVNKGPASLGIGEQTSRAGGKFVDLMVRRSKKGYQVGMEGNWSIAKAQLSQLPNSEIEFVRDRMTTVSQ